MQRNYFVMGGMETFRTYDDTRSYTVLRVERDEQQFQFKIYVNDDFVRFIALYQCHYFTPIFGLDELYKEALEATI
ncbi:hypothetical protein ACFQ3S_11010 [Mucilaginibacter terrae]|uniref:hypothetical protein n=1 Tax=Mucilaginibacter terrae TaxID=1955052 RepID=UPI00362B6028